MRTLNQTGLANALLIPFILVLLLFIGAAGFGVWAFESRQDYKNNTDQKIAAAVTVAQKQTTTSDQNKFDEEEKSPLKTYNGPAAYGSIAIQYPKTWSAYIDEASTDGSSTPVDGYWYPDFVPNLQGSENFALRVQVVQTAYSDALKSFDGLTKTGKVTVSAFQAPKVPGVVGARIDGTIEPNKQGSMVLLPLRDKTLKIWTESSDFSGDFNNTILPNLTFSP